MPRWQSVLLPFLTETWLAVLGAALLALLLLYALSWILVTSDETLSGRSLSFISFYILGIHLKNSRPQLPVRASLRIFVIFLWVYVMIVMEAYSAKLMAFLAVERSPAGMNTLEETVPILTPIYGQSPFWARTSGSCAKRVCERGFLPFNTALGVQSHSPLKRNIDRTVRWVVEPDSSTTGCKKKLIIAKRGRQRPSPRWKALKQRPGAALSFSLDHLQGVFFVYGTGVAWRCWCYWRTTPPWAREAL
ncbi:Ionotropic receptor 93a [Chionoecetes opilio]|uniref:Ionotropic receptor 93a n=1 Tax=Chionoecetes opilio TaxID=41210 RepID=A0A8J5C1Y5_CHIOP|nr:Ionotropic receptor 93a [Chionoecetes opilio]